MVVLSISDAIVLLLLILSSQNCMEEVIANSEELMYKKNDVFILVWFCIVKIGIYSHVRLNTIDVYIYNVRVCDLIERPENSFLPLHVANCFLSSINFISSSVVTWERIEV